MAHLSAQPFSSGEPGSWPASPPSNPTPSASVNRFLAMIPRNLPALPAPGSVLGAEPALKAAEVANRLLSRIELDEGPSWPAEAAEQPWLPTPRVILKRKTMVERAERITQAALNCGRIHTNRAEQLYRLLTTAALAYHFQLSPEAKVIPNRLAFFCVVDELPELLGISRATIYRALGDLKAGGLVDHRAWYTSSQLAGGKTVAGGVVMEVVLTPQQGTQARVRAEYMRGKYRDLDADRHAGNTAWQWKTEVKEGKALARQLEEQADNLPPPQQRQAEALRARAEGVRQSISFQEIEMKINRVLHWTLYITNPTPVSLTVSPLQDVVYQLGDLLTATPQQRGTLIQERAQALCEAVGDQDRNRRFWCWLLWRGLELEASQPMCLVALQTALLRLMADIREWAQDHTTQRPLRRPAALFVSRLKKSGWWAELKAVRLTPPFHS